MSTLRDGLDTLGKYLNRPISAEARIAYAQALAGIDDRGVADTLANWMRSHSPSSTLPSPQELRGFAREKAARAEAGNPRDTTQPWALLEQAARNKPYQRAVARMMRAAMAGGPQIAAQLYRAFAAEHGESVPWERMAQDAEIEAASRKRGRAA